MTAPQWAPVDDSTADLLSVLAHTNQPIPGPEAEWQEFTACLRLASVWDAGTVTANRMRPLIKDKVAPRRVGPFYRKACLEGLIRATDDWEPSNDHGGKNAGRPTRKYVWIGGRA